jgi:proteic killer suppression protein
VQGHRGDLHLEGSRRFRNIEQAAYRRLVMLDGAHTLSDLAAMRSNRLEPLRGDRAGQYSIRVNDQWRICLCGAEMTRGT